MAANPKMRHRGEFSLDDAAVPALEKSADEAKKAWDEFDKAQGDKIEAEYEKVLHNEQTAKAAKEFNDFVDNNFTVNKRAQKKLK